MSASARNRKGLPPDSSTPATVSRRRRRRGLRYGTVGLNEHAGYAVGVPHLIWGAYPGNTPEAIGSGIGFVNNALMLPRPEQGVLRAAFRAPVKPFSTATHKTLGAASTAVTEWIASGDNPLKIPTIVLPALRG